MGPCAGSVFRYYFDQYEGRCQQFIYSGCGGNDNNFETRAACERSCPSESSTEEPTTTTETSTGTEPPTDGEAQSGTEGGIRWPSVTGPGEVETGSGTESLGSRYFIDCAMT